MKTCAGFSGPPCENQPRYFTSGGMFVSSKREEVAMENPSSGSR